MGNPLSVIAKLEVILKNIKLLLRDIPEGNKKQNWPPKKFQILLELKVLLKIVALCRKYPH